MPLISGIRTSVTMHPRSPALKFARKATAEFISTNVDIRRTKQKFERTSYRVIVVDDMHQGAIRHCSDPLGSLFAW